MSGEVVILDLTSALLLGSVYLNVYLAYRYVTFRKGNDKAARRVEREEISIIKKRMTKLKEEMETWSVEDLM